MKKVVCAIVSVLSFILLTGLAGGRECGTLTENQFVLWFIVTFLVMAISAILGGRLSE